MDNWRLVLIQSCTISLVLERQRQDRIKGTSTMMAESRYQSASRKGEINFSGIEMSLCGSSENLFEQPEIVKSFKIGLYLTIYFRRLTQ